MSDGLSKYDLTMMTEIIKEGRGDWYHADLLRALYTLMRHADSQNLARLQAAYPGSTAAIQLWYNSPNLEGLVQESEPATAEARPPMSAPP